MTYKLKLFGEPYYDIADKKLVKDYTKEEKKKYNAERDLRKILREADKLKNASRIKTIAGAWNHYHREIERRKKHEARLQKKYKSMWQGSCPECDYIFRYDWANHGYIPPWCPKHTNENKLIELKYESDITRKTGKPAI